MKFKFNEKTSPVYQRLVAEERRKELITLVNEMPWHKLCELELSEELAPQKYKEELEL